jgi:hypothetical protein
MEPTDATIIGVYFLNYIKIISTCLGYYYAHHQEKIKRDWLTLHVKLHEALTSLVFLSPDDGHNNARNM